MHQSPWNRRTAMSATLGLLLPLLLLALCAGCGFHGFGGVRSAPVALPLPTAQAGNLVVVASVVSDTNAAGDFTTSFKVSVADTRTGAAATGATVEFSTPGGTVSLSEDPEVPGTYRARRSGHAEGLYALAVARGTDVASGAVDMPESIRLRNDAEVGDIRSNVEHPSGMGAGSVLQASVRVSEVPLVAQ